MERESLGSQERGLRGEWVASGSLLEERLAESWRARALEVRGLCGAGEGAVCVCVCVCECRIQDSCHERCADRIIYVRCM